MTGMAAPVVGRFRTAQALIGGGCAVFVLALAIAAVFEPGLRWLHFFQALMYVAAWALGRRGNRWGYFIGSSAAAFWNYILLFVSPIPAQLAADPTRPDLLIQAAAWVANLLIIVGSIRCTLGPLDRSHADLARLAAAFVGTTAYLAAAVALFSPERLEIFVQALHPHWP